MERRLSDLITQKNVIKALSTSGETLRAYRQRGLPYVNVGGKILYWEQDLVEWLTNNQTRRETGPSLREKATA